MPAPLHIITLVKWVPDAQLERHFSADQRVDRSEGILGELDEYPLESALQLKESASGRDVRVTALTVGPEGASAALKKALQIGADDAVHLTDPALTGADIWGTAAAAAAAIATTRDAGSDLLVLTGMTSDDGESGAVPAQVAERLQAALLSQATSLELQDERITVTRTSGNEQETVAAGLPAVVTVTDQANDPRYPNFRAIMKARKKPVVTVSLAETGLSPDQVSAKARALTAEERPAREPGPLIHDDGTAGTQIVDFLEKERLL